MGTANHDDEEEGGSECLPGHRVRVEAFTTRATALAIDAACRLLDELKRVELRQQEREKAASVLATQPSPSNDTVAA